jgi:hypothetical protein
MRESEMPSAHLGAQVVEGRTNAQTSVEEAPESFIETVFGGKQLNETSAIFLIINFYLCKYNL